MSVDAFSPVCASGSQWYACPSSSSSKFVGCCASDPCGTKGCSQGNLNPVAFNASTYGTFPDPMCGGSSLFYGCVNIPTNTSTFWGCCKSNPCTQDQKCPEADLVPAYMGQPEQFEWYAKEGSSSTSSSSSSTSSPSASPSAAAELEAGHTHMGVIVGTSVAGVVAIVAIISLLIFFLCRRKKSAARKGSVNSPAAAPLARGEEKYDSKVSPFGEAPPGYSSPNPQNGSTSPLSPAAGGYPHHYQHVYQSPVEMSADHIHSPSTAQHFSELPAKSMPNVMAELDDPQPSPRPLHSEKGAAV